MHPDKRRAKACKSCDRNEKKLINLLVGRGDGKQSEERDGDFLVNQ